jgi:hypothetical protein
LKFEGLKVEVRGVEVGGEEGRRFDRVLDDKMMFTE